MYWLFNKCMCIQHYLTHTMAIKTTVYVIKADITVCWISFWVPSFARTLALLNRLPISLQSSAGNWYQGVHAVLVLVWQPIRVLPNTQYYPLLENIGQYPIPQCQYRSNPINVGRKECLNGHRMLLAEPWWTPVIPRIPSFWLGRNWTHPGLTGTKKNVQFGKKNGWVLPG